MTHTGSFYQEAWLLVAQGGGWWRTSEILEQLPPDLGADDPASRLWIMANRYHYLARRGRGQTAEYAITDECITPRGLTVKRLNQALFGAQQDPAATRRIRAGQPA